MSCSRHRILDQITLDFYQQVLQSPRMQSVQSAVESSDGQCQYAASCHEVRRGVLIIRFCHFPASPLYLESGQSAALPANSAMGQQQIYLSLSTQPVAIALAQASIPLLRASAAMAVLS
jgi:hypothetical protein